MVELAREDDVGGTSSSLPFFLLAFDEVTFVFLSGGYAGVDEGDVGA